MRSRLHDPTFHYGKDKLSELIEIGAGREVMLGIAKALADGGRPAVEIGRDLIVDFSTRRVDFEGKASDGAGECAIGYQDFLAISIQQKKYALDGILSGAIHGLEKNGFEICQIPIENSLQKMLLALEEKVETTAVGAGFLEDLSHARCFITLLVEEFDGSQNDAVACS